MNALEQREHRTVTRALQQQINDLIAVVSALEAQQATIYGETVDTLAAERTARLAMMERFRASIGEEQKQRLAMTADRDRRIAEWEALTLRQRLRWVFRGIAR